MEDSISVANMNQTYQGFQNSTPDYEMTTEVDRTQTPGVPSILMANTFQISRDKFNQSVHFDANKIIGLQSKEEDKFWSTSAVDFNNQVMKMSENDQKLVNDLKDRIKSQR